MVKKSLTPRQAYAAPDTCAVRIVQEHCIATSFEPEPELDLDDFDNNPIYSED